MFFLKDADLLSFFYPNGSLEGSLLPTQYVFICQSQPKHCLTLFLLSQMDHDPRNPTYIASQGPLPSTVTDFWQVKPIFTVCLSSFFICCHYSSDGFGEPQQNSTASDIFCVVYKLMCTYIFFLVQERNNYSFKGVSPAGEFLYVELVK